MKFIRRKAEFVACIESHGERLNEYRCPNKKCGMSVSEDYTNCPYCGQKIKFEKPKPSIEMRILLKRL
jgi:DNA-directed RNA polymerase subunit RPC12/RpoP